MKNVLITAYAINPYKGSEDGMGWNYVIQAAKENKIIAITRHNNRASIEAFIAKDKVNNRLYENIKFMYFDWPQWTLFWKKGPLLSMIYYYFWQLSLALWLKRKKLDVDIVHNLNFHNDWTPSFLWLLNKPFVWGPVGHHPKIPKNYVIEYGRREYIKDRLLWLLKWCFWNLDPLLYLTKKKAKYIWCMHKEAAEKLKLKENFFVHPSIAADAVEVITESHKNFTVLSVGRFVPLKGFDVTIRSFAAFYRSLPVEKRVNVRLQLIGKGPYKKMIQDLIAIEGVGHVTEVLDWMPQQALHQAYRQAAVLLYPSHEGAGMVVAETMRYRTPILCWNNCGPGTIVHPDSKLKIDYAGYDDCIGAFADKLLYLYQDSTFYQKESELADRRFKESLDWDIKSGQLNNFYSHSSK